MSTRRQFLQMLTAAGALAASTRSLVAAEHGHLAWPHPLGLQIYTVRDAYAKDPLDTLKRVHAAGYAEAELIGLDSIPADQLKSDLRQAQLRAVSAHVGLPKDDDEWKKFVDIGHTVGLNYLVIPFVMRKEADEWKKLADQLNHLADLTQPAGMNLCYHNHWQEFRPVDDTNGFEIMMKNTDPKKVNFEMDVFWTVYAKKDPVALFHEHPGRFPMIHAKDIKKELTPDKINSLAFPAGVPFAPVGQGRIDWKRVFANLKVAGTKHVFVEQDKTDGDPFVAIRESAQYLKHLRI